MLWLRAKSGVTNASRSRHIAVTASELAYKAKTPSGQKWNALPINCLRGEDELGDQLTESGQREVGGLTMMNDDTAAVLNNFSRTQCNRKPETETRCPSMIGVVRDALILSCATGMVLCLAINAYAAITVQGPLSNVTRQSAIAYMSELQKGHSLDEATEQGRSVASTLLKQAALNPSAADSMIFQLDFDEPSNTNISRANILVEDVPLPFGTNINFPLIIRLAKTSEVKQSSSI